MPSETTKLDSSSLDKEKQQNLDLEIREMISTLTKRLSSLQHVHNKAAGASGHNEDDADDDSGMRIITLAGNNVGATMRGEKDEKPDGDMSTGENEALSTYVNSNFQAINNSIMLGGSYSTKDPGVHMDISDYLEDPPKHGKKEKKKKKASHKSGQETEHSE